MNLSHPRRLLAAVAILFAVSCAGPAASLVHAEGDTPIIHGSKP
jgi:hypothetical protein